MMDSGLAFQMTGEEWKKATSAIFGHACDMVTLSVVSSSCDI